MQDGTILGSVVVIVVVVVVVVVVIENDVINRVCWLKYVKSETKLINNKFWLLFPHFVGPQQFTVHSLTLRRLMSYIYIWSTHS